MNVIRNFIGKILGFIRRRPLERVEGTPPLNMTRILLDPKNILIMPYNRMGTTLLTTRVFKAIREHYPAAKITAAVNEPWSILISKDPVVDEVIGYGEDIENPSSEGFKNIGQALADEHFDLAFFLSYQFDPAIAYLISRSRADLRVSFKTGTEVPYFNVEIVPAPGNRYEVERYLELLRTLGIEGTPRDYTLKISDTVREKARRRHFPDHSPAGKKCIVGYDLTREIAGETIGKKTTESHIRALIEGFDASVAVVYEPAKKKRADELKEIFGKRVIPVEDRPVTTLAGALSFCRFAVTRNTDLLQLAIAMKTPTIGILTASENIRWAPPQCPSLTHLMRSDDSWPSGETLVAAAHKAFSEPLKQS